MGLKSHVKETITATINGKKKISFLNHEPSEVEYFIISDLGKPKDTITFKGEILGLDQFGRELRLKTVNGAVMSFILETIVDIRQGDKLTNKG